MYTAEMADTIIDHLEEGRSVLWISRLAGMPHESVIRKWAKDDREGFAARYLKAREIGYLKLADEILEIADDGSNDTYVRQDGTTAPNIDHIQRSRLRVDTRKWVLAKMLPKVYGDKLDLNHSGELRTITDEAVESRVADLLRKARATVTLGGADETKA